MKLNDPFGRVARREQQEYESLRETLKKSGVHTHKDAVVVLERTQVRGRKIVFAVLFASVLVALLYPSALTITLIFSGIALLWSFNMMKNARKHIQRYVEEELSESDQQGSD